MVCVASWLRRAVELDDRAKRILVVDEAWAVLGTWTWRAGCGASWEADPRHCGQNIAVDHRLSDLEAAGGRDSEQVRLARGLLADSQTKVIFRQAPAERALMRDLCLGQRARYR